MSGSIPFAGRLEGRLGISGTAESWFSKSKESVWRGFVRKKSGRMGGEYSQLGAAPEFAAFLTFSKLAIFIRLACLVGC